MRKFYQHFHCVWPYWFYFCDLRTETLTMMTLCLLPNLSGFKRLGEPRAAVEYDPKDLPRFIAQNWVPLNMMMERAGMSEMDIYHRSREIFLHYKLPYDQPPPEELCFQPTVFWCLDDDPLQLVVASILKRCGVRIK